MDRKPARTARPGTEERKKRRSYIQRLEGHLGRRILAGFFVVIPLGVTYLILRFVQVNLDGYLRPLLGDTPLDFTGIGAVVFLLALYIIGAVVAWRFGKMAMSWQRALFSRIPIVKSIYNVATQTADALQAPIERRFSRVVFVEWPRPGVFSLGFVTGYLPSADGGSAGKVVVFLPQSPNPTTGNLAFVSVQEVVDTDISVEDAMKIIFSLGIVLPTNVSHQEPPRRVG